MRAIIIIAFFSVVGILSGYIVGKRIYFKMRNTPVVVPADPITERSIVFVGTSLTVGLPVKQYFGPLAVNEGVGSNATIHILERIGDIAKGKPSKIFLEAGINDIHDRVPIDSILVNYSAIVDSIHYYSPETKVLMQSVFPVSSGRYQDLQPRTVALNEKLKVLAMQKNATYLDFFPAMGGVSGLAPGISIDGLHLNVRGYERWEDAIRPYVK